MGELDELYREAKAAIPGNGRGPHDDDDEGPELWADDEFLPEPPADTKEERPNPRRKREIGERIPQETATAIEARARAIPCPDPVLMQRVGELLTASKIPSKTRRQHAGALVLDWLTQHGEFIRSETEETFYLYKPQRKLYNLLTNHWKAFLYSLAGTNPAGSDFAHIQADCETAAMLAKVRPVLRVAAWDKVNQVLRVSRFDGTLYKLDGENITEEGNGESVLFDDGLFWQPYQPDYSKGDIFSWMADSYFDTDDKIERERYKLALRAWELSTFFPELIPTRPPLVFIGEKGSGKSMTLRRFGRALYGSNYELSGVPDKPDGFTAAAAAAHVLSIDNLDDFHGWMRDKIARLTTGGIDEYRKLYTSNEVGRVVYRCWLAFTSRTPDTLRRDDLSDRLLLLPVKRIREEHIKTERAFLDATEQMRGAWWGSLLTRLNQIVAGIRKGGLQTQARLRMADWETFGRLVATQEGKLDPWNEFIDGLKAAQTSFLLEGDPIAEAILTWVDKHPEKHDQDISASELLNVLTDELYSTRKPPRDWPDTTKKFARRLQMIREALKALIDISWVNDHRVGYIYRFSKKE